MSSDKNRTDVRLDDPLLNGLYIEVAANELFGAGKGGMIEPPDPNKTFPLNKARIVVFNRRAYDVLMDFDILMGMAKLLPTNNQRRYQALYTGNHMVRRRCSLRIHTVPRTFKILGKSLRILVDPDSTPAIYAISLIVCVQ